MLKNYELLYILHPDLEGTSEKVSEKVASIIKKVDGEVTNQEDWGKRKLAYPIARNDFGVYVLVNFSLNSEKLPEVERDLRLSEEIMRFMIVALPEEKPDKKKTNKTIQAKTEKKEKEVRAEEPAKEETPEITETKVKEEKKEKKASPKKVKTETEESKETKKPAKKEKTEKIDEEAERMKKLDAKLEEILGE